MNQLLAGMQQIPTALTWNGDAAHATTWDANLDLFGDIGSCRKDQAKVLNLFQAAFKTDEDIAVRTALWARDVRGGAGERESFRTILKWLGDKKPEIAKQVAYKVAEVGRWDDLLVLLPTKAKDTAVQLLAQALVEGNGLCAKWMPRKGPVAAMLRTEFKMTPKQYRKLLVALTDCVETKMCAKQWDQIDFGKLPALASARYQKAFERNAPGQYKAYEKALEDGTAKINAGAIFPHDVLTAALKGNDVVSSAQWKALPDYMAGTEEKVLAMVDVSESMSCGINGTGAYSSGASCMQVAVALGMYCAERNNGPFKDHFVTFTDCPTLIYSNPALGLKARWNDAIRHKGYSTNFDAAYRMILETAVKNKVPAEDMPTILLVLSDMQFNAGWGYSQTANERLKQSYQAAGYKVPKLVYWNLHAMPGNKPITMHDKNCALVSGFAPAILTSVMQADDIDPIKVMLKAVTVPRYDWKFQE